VSRRTGTPELNAREKEPNTPQENYTIMPGQEQQDQGNRVVG